jgi:hypothetical protein
MLQQNPKVNAVLQALPDQRTMSNVVSEIDTKSLRHWGVVISLFLLSLAIAIVPPVMVGLTTGSAVVGSYFDCQPDGTVALPWDDHDYDNWRISSLLDISIAFGNMSFPVAKLIDVLWDTVVGRGGQALLTLLIYRVLSQSLLYSMETRPSSFRKFSATAFETGTFTALRVFIQDLHRKRRGRNLQSTLMVLAFVLCTSYVLAFPTILSGITGYQAKSDAFCENPDDGSLFNTDQLERIVFRISDGSRIGLSDDYPVTENSGRYYSIYSLNLPQACYECKLADTSH